MAVGLSISPSANLHLLRLDAASMAILRRPLNMRPRLNLRHSRFSAISAALRQDTTAWTQAPLASVTPAAESLFHVAVDVADSPDLAASYSRPGQYLQLRVPDSAKPAFLAIASPPALAAAKGVFEFLVKSIAGSTAELLCGLRGGDLVEVSPAMGKGFGVEEISPPEEFPTVLIFATGSGIRYFKINKTSFLYYYFHFIKVELISNKHISAASIKKKIKKSHLKLFLFFIFYFFK